MGSHKKLKSGGMVKPKKAKGKRRTIGSKLQHEAGGPHTPGAKKKRKDLAKKRRKSRGA